METKIEIGTKCIFRHDRNFFTDEKTKGYDNMVVEVISEPYKSGGQTFVNAQHHTNWIRPVMIQELFPIAIELEQSEEYYNNIKRYGEGLNTCICCGKRIKDIKYFVHLNTDLQILHTSILEEDALQKTGCESQGLFPIGSECKNKVGKEYLILND